MSGRGIKAARAFVEVFMDDKALRRGVKSVQATMRGMAAGVGKVGGALFGGASALAAPLILSVKRFANIGDEVDKIAARTGVSTTALSQLGFAAEQTGADLAALEKGFAGQSRSLFDLKRGSAEAVDGYSAIGLSIKDLEGLAPERQMEVIADGLAGVADASTRGAVAQKIFGRAGRQLLPMLQLGAKGMRALREEGDKFGRTIGPEQAASAAELTDAWNRASSVFTGIFLQVGGALAPTISDLTDKVAEGGIAVVDFVKNNQGLIKAIAVGIFIVGALGASLLVLSGTLYGAAAVLGILTSPLAIVAGLAIGAGVALVKFGSIGSISVEKLREKFGPLADRAVAAFQSIKDALSAGDYTLAAKLLWLSLKEAFLTGMLPLREAWVGFSQIFLEVFNNMSTKVASGYVKLTGFIAEQLIKLQGYFDESIDVEDIQRTLQEDIERKIKVIDTDGDARQTEIEAQTVQQLAKLKTEIDAARAELKTAQGSAKTAADAAEAAAAVAGGDEPGGAFAKLLEDLKNGNAAAAISKKTQPKAAPTASQDLRSVAGIGQLLQLVNERNLDRDQLKAQQGTKSEVQQLREDLAEAKRQGFLIG